MSAEAMGQALVPMVGMIWRFALSLCRDRDVADDLVQATCLRAMEKHGLYDGTGRLDGWCLKICRSIWLNQLRSNKIRAHAGIDQVPEADLRAMLPEAEANIFAGEVFTAMMSLPEAQRETVYLVYYEGFRYSEAAATLEVPIGTIMSRLSAARAKLNWMNDMTPQTAAKKGRT